MSIAAIHPPAVVYREEQNFGWWVYALLGLMLAFGLLLTFSLGAVPRRHGLEFPLGLLVGLTLPSVLVVGVLRLTTEVAPGMLRVWLGWVPTFRRAYDLSSVARVEVVRYRPLRDYGGWGLRIGRDGERVYSARGDHGVRLHFSDGSKVLIGSQRPEALAAAIEQAIRPNS